MDTDLSVYVYSVRLISGFFALGVAFFAAKTIRRRFRKHDIFFDILAFAAGLALAFTFIIGAINYGPSLDTDVWLRILLRIGVLFMLCSMFGLYERRSNGI
jgi:hypothetical protein